MFSSLTRFALLCVCLVGAGCAGNGPPPATSTSSFDAIQTTIFNVHCLSAGCHNSTDQAGNLVLAAGESYADLVNVAPFNTAARGRGLLRVVPGDPDHSFLLIKLTGPPSDEGSQMPLVPPLLSTAQIAQVRQWILAGAPGSSVPTMPPTATPTDTPTPTSTPTPIATSTATAADTAISTSTPTNSGTPTLTPTGTLPATPTPTRTSTVTLTPTNTATPSPTATATATSSPPPIPTPTFSLASTFPQIQANIFTPTCLGLSCHNATDQGGGMVLEGSAAYTNLVGVTPFNMAAMQRGLLRVDPGLPANSFLITKLTLPSASDPQFGSRMPLLAPPLATEQIDTIRAWILRGALPDETPPPGAD